MIHTGAADTTQNMAPLNSLHAHRPVFGAADPHKDHPLVLRTHTKARPVGRRVLRTPRSKLFILVLWTPLEILLVIPLLLCPPSSIWCCGPTQRPLYRPLYCGPTQKHDRRDVLCCGHHAANDSHWLLLLFLTFSVLVANPKNYFVCLFLSRICLASEKPDKELPGIVGARGDTV